MANAIYYTSWWGSPERVGWASIYYDFNNPLTREYEARVIVDGGTIEAIECVNNADFN